MNPLLLANCIKTFSISTFLFSSWKSMGVMCERGVHASGYSLKQPLLWHLTVFSHLNTLTQEPHYITCWKCIRITNLCPDRKAARRAQWLSGRSSPGPTGWMNWSDSRGWAWLGLASLKHPGSCPCSPQNCFLKRTTQKRKRFNSLNEAERKVGCLVFLKKKLLWWFYREIN